MAQKSLFLFCRAGSRAQHQELNSGRVPGGFREQPAVTGSHGRRRRLPVWGVHVRSAAAQPQAGLAALGAGTHGRRSRHVALGPLLTRDAPQVATLKLILP